MIDFRYHLVSLIAVFLAVALGIVIGTTQLNGPVLSNLQTQVTALQQDKRSLEDTTQGLKAQVNTSDAFEQAIAPALVKGTLTGRRVLLVVANDQVAQDTVDQVTTLVGQAGGTLTGSIRLQPEYSDPATENALQSYVTGPGRPAGIELPTVDDAGKLVASLLAQVLMVPAHGAPPARRRLLGAGRPVGAEGPRQRVLGRPGRLRRRPHRRRLPGRGRRRRATRRSSTWPPRSTPPVRAASWPATPRRRGGPGWSASSGPRRPCRPPSPRSTTSTPPPGRSAPCWRSAAEGKGTSGKYGSGQDTQPVPPVPAATP